MKGSAVDLSVRIESDVNEVIDIVLVDQIRIVGLGGDVEDAVIVRGIGSRGLAGDQIVDNGDEDLGQLVGVEEGPSWTACRQGMFLTAASSAS